ncbi:MAG: hypothetical protein V8Q42_06340 [Anaerovoracaceae bacterium]
MKKKSVNSSDKSNSGEKNVMDGGENSSDGNDRTPDAKITIPLNGEMIMKRCADMPIYMGATLDECVTHSGLDIAAPGNERPAHAQAAL